MDLLHQPQQIIAQRYRVLGILGQGGTGITYEALDLTNQQRVAVKALSLRRLTDWKMLELFEREAGILAQLNHPAIPRYLDYFHIDTPEDRSFYIVQQVAEGQSLAALVESGWRTNELEVKRIASQILQILGYLHSLTPPVVHRDIKPHNLIRQADGQIKLVDFGAVQHTYYDTFMRGSTVVGTYGYMAPEQFRGQAVPATDLYSLGATLLFLLTHRSPADLPTNRLKINFRDSVQISQQLADWLEQMLEPDLETRFSSAQEALAALQGKLKKPKATQTYSSTPWKAIASIVVATVVTVGILNHYKYPLLSSIGFTPRAMYEGIKDGDIKTVQYYLDQGVNPNALDFQNHSPLHWAVSNNKVQIAALLIDRGARVNDSYDADGHTVFHVAVQHNTPDMAKLLIARGADIHARDNFGNNALHFAISKKDRFYYYGMTLNNPEPSKAMLDLLVSQGVDLNAKNHAGRTPSQMAQTQETIELLKSYGATR